MIGEADPKNKASKIENENSIGKEGVQVAEAVLIQQEETPKKSGGRETTPASSRSRRGKK